MQQMKKSIHNIIPFLNVLILFLITSYSQMTTTIFELILSQTVKEQQKKKKEECKKRKSFLFSFFHSDNIASSMFRTMRLVFRSFVFAHMCVHSFNFLLASKPKILLHLCHTSRFSSFSVLTFVVIGHTPPCFSDCSALFFSIFFLSSLSIHSVPSSETMSYPAVHYVKCITSLDE